MPAPTQTHSAGPLQIVLNDDPVVKDLSRTIIVPHDETSLNGGNLALDSPPHRRPTFPAPISLLQSPPSPPYANARAFLSTSNVVDFSHTQDLNGVNSPPPPRSAGANSTSHRHMRIHSRNLSVFFPRNPTPSQPYNVEDAFPDSEPELMHREVPSLIRSGGLQPGFTFGGRPPEAGSGSALPAQKMGAMARRGHHHKHSLSHNLFTFLEPASSPSPTSPKLHTQPTPIPVSPWNATFSQTTNQTKKPISRASASPQISSPTSRHTRVVPDDEPQRWVGAVTAAAAQFVLGTWVWVLAQRVGSLASTGLGYWVVFDAFGVVLGCVVPKSLSENKSKDRVRRPYGNARFEAVLMFAQSVFLMFSSVYVCKEMLEHLLLSVGEGHHHHHGDEDVDILGIDFPGGATLIAMLSTISTALLFKSNFKLASTAGTRIPPLRTLLKSIIFGHPIFKSTSSSLPTRPSGLQALLSNPFAAFPILFCMAILLVASLSPQSQHRRFDLAIAAIETVITFQLSYRACVVLGAVLLQTSPRRGLIGGRMEAFLRVMKEIERHPLVLHLPAPHIWQLTPSETHDPQAQTLIATIELHVRRDASDADVLKLTRWAWERCLDALRYGSKGTRMEDGCGEGRKVRTEVTVGIVRG